MKIHALHDPVAETVIVACDHAQRCILAEATEMARGFCRTDWALYLIDRCTPKAVDNIIDGLETLRELSTNPATPLVFGVEEMRCALTLACFTATCEVLGKGSPTSLSRAILMLSQAAPFPVRRLSLPPSVEVFPQNVEPGVRATYEYIRDWRQVGAPHAFLDHLHRLACELRRHTPLTGDLHVLMKEIEAATALFRSAMQSLALAELDATGDGNEEDPS
jgi:hypothetical protein